MSYYVDELAREQLIRDEARQYLETLTTKQMSKHNKISIKTN